MKIQADVKNRLRPLYSEAQLAARIEELAQDIAGRKLEDPLAIAVLKGSFMFAADLLRALHNKGVDLEVEFMMLASYHEGTTSSGQVSVTKDIESSVQGRDILLIDDILETGRTLSYARDLLMARGAKSVLICCLLEKPGKRAVTLNADVVGFVCPDLFVVGYGMDLAHSFRELPYVGHILSETETA